MSTRIIITVLIAAALIVGGVLLFENSSTPVDRAGSVSEKTTRTEERAPARDTPSVVPAGWPRYRHESVLFTINYPTDWSYRTEGEASATLSLRPPSRATQEVESNPRILLTRVPLVNILGTHESLGAWFDAEVKKNPERWDARTDTMANNPRYAFTEGAGEYPHENIIIVHGATAYWFTIEASDPAMHAVLPLIAASLRFEQ